MTEMLKKEFSRKTFVKSGGAMIVGFSLAGAGLAGKAQAAESPFASNGPFDLQAVDSFIVIHTDNTASINSGRVELGQGTGTGLLQVAAEELDMDMSQVLHVRHDSNVTPNTGQTAASNSTGSAGPRVRAAAAYAKQALLGLAATQLGVPASTLSVSKGVVSGAGRSVTYGALIGDKLFNVRMPTATLTTGVAPAKSPGQYKLMGTRVPRVDIPDKVTGKFTYIHNVLVPGMWHGRVVRPRGQWVYGAVPKVLSVDESSIKNVPGARLVRKADFIGVVAPSEYSAIQAAAQLKVEWADPPTALPGSGNVFKAMRAQDSAGQTIQQYFVNTGNVNAALASAARAISQTYSWQHQSHTPISPSCAIADVTPDGARILTYVQDLYTLRTLVAQLTGLPMNKVRITYFESGSSYGFAPYVDAVKAATVMSQAIGMPVRVQFMRWDELGWDRVGQAHLFDIRGALDGNGRIVGFDYTVFASAHKSPDTVEATDEMLGTPVPLQTTASPFGEYRVRAGGGAYNIANLRVLLKTVPIVNQSPRVSWLRSPGIIQATFAVEQFIDELAYAAKMDPVDFRRRNISQDETSRWLGVLDAVTQAANWQPRVAASNLSNNTVVTGRGAALGPTHGGIGTGGTHSWSATIADIEVNKKTGKIVAKHVYTAGDTGHPINPNLIENQIVGAVTQGVSRTLIEAVRSSKTNVTSLDFVSYPILRFNDAPNVTPITVARTSEQPGGAGDIGQGTVGAALANAFFDATGLRIRQVPMTPAVVRAVLAAGGSGTAGVK